MEKYEKINIVPETETISNCTDLEHNLNLINFPQTSTDFREKILAWESHLYFLKQHIKTPIKK